MRVKLKQPKRFRFQFDILKVSVKAEARQMLATHVVERKEDDKD